ncbi:MAG: SIMPL domain-containing protein [Propionibacteriaceae bacterium]|jgi:uncharacterized protein YggE|nr:SIMPL domain-containing protein [Propionibacteriaceae bacterium]
MPQINVFGNAIGTVMPDVATISVTVGVTGHPTLEAAQAQFAAAMPQVQAILKPAAGAYTQRRMRVGSYRDYPKDIELHTVTAEVTAKFADDSVDQVGELVTRLAVVAGISVDTAWSVSPQKMKDANDALLAEAVIDAQRQVNAIARAGGVQVVEPILFAEPELFPGAIPSSGGREPGLLRAGLAMAKAETTTMDNVEVDLEPEPVDVSARIAVSYLVK